jgi:hypothetical protein
MLPANVASTTIHNILFLHKRSPCRLLSPIWFWLARASQPGKLRIQDRDRFGGGFQVRNGTRDGFQRSVPWGAPASAVTAVGSSAARSNAAQTFGGLVEQDVGVVGHVASRHDHSSLQPRQLSSPKCTVGADSIDEKAMVPVARRRWSRWREYDETKNPDPVAWRRLAGKKRGPVAGSGAMNAKPHPVKRVIEFPKLPAAVDGINREDHFRGRRRSDCNQLDRED